MSKWQADRSLHGPQTVGCHQCALTACGGSHSQWVMRPGYAPAVHRALFSALRLHESSQSRAHRSDGPGEEARHPHCSKSWQSPTVQSSAGEKLSEEGQSREDRGGQGQWGARKKWDLSGVLVHRPQVSRGRKVPQAGSGEAGMLNLIKTEWGRSTILLHGS